MRPIDLQPTARSWLASMAAINSGFQPCVGGVLTLVDAPRSVDSRRRASRRRDSAVHRLAVRVAHLTPVDQITEDQLFLWSLQLRAEGYSEDMAGRVRSLLRRAARALSLVTGDPCTVDAHHAMGRRIRPSPPTPLEVGTDLGASPPCDGSTETPSAAAPRHRWSPTEIASVHGATRGRLARLVIALVVGGGMFPDELLDQTLGSGGGYRFLTAPSTARKPRYVPTAAWAARAVRQHDRALKRSGAGADAPLLGANPRGALSFALEAIRAAQIDAGYGHLPPLTWEDLRGVFVDAASAACVPPRFVAGEPTPETWDPSDRLFTWDMWARFAAAWTDLGRPPLTVPPRRRSRSRAAAA